MFLLSVSEVVRYFGDSGHLKNHKNKGVIDDEYNSARKAYESYGWATWWWLRSEGYNQNLSGVDDDGSIVFEGSPTWLNGSPSYCSIGGVRPAFWLELSRV